MSAASRLTLRLLLVDGDADHADRLAGELRALGHSVDRAADGRSALRAIDRDAFDAVLLERQLPGLDGIAVVHRLRGAEQRLPVIMLSTLAQTADKVAGLDAGADDYLVKPVAVAELDARLHAIVRARRWTGSGGDTIAAGDIVVSPTSFRAWQAGAPLALSRLQFRLLAELVRDADTVLTRATLIRRVWGHDVAPTGNIVDAQICGLRLKLAPADRIVTVRGVGYRLRS